MGQHKCMHMRASHKPFTWTIFAALFFVVFHSKSKWSVACVRRGFSFAHIYGITDFRFLFVSRLKACVPFFQWFSFLKSPLICVCDSICLLVTNEHKFHFRGEGKQIRAHLIDQYTYIYMYRCGVSKEWNDEGEWGRRESARAGNCFCVRRQRRNQFFLLIRLFIVFERFSHKHTNKQIMTPIIFARWFPISTAPITTTSHPLQIKHPIIVDFVCFAHRICPPFRQHIKLLRICVCLHCIKAQRPFSSVSVTDDLCSLRYHGVLFW